jgi:hypothetical protein
VFWFLLFLFSVVCESFSSSSSSFSAVDGWYRRDLADCLLQSNPLPSCVHPAIENDDDDDDEKD